MRTLEDRVKLNLDYMNSPVRIRNWFKNQRRSYGRPLDYVKAAKHEYKVLFGDGRLKKEKLDKKQIALLSMMETLESLVLSECEDSAMSVHEAIHHMDDKPALLAPVMERLRLGGVA